ncbi:UDP-N-acetylmuramate--L-alanine ligase [bacterium]|nr:UDP-N-acetylmuramate--L-alanine ligase [bacterium]
MRPASVRCRPDRVQRVPALQMALPELAALGPAYSFCTSSSNAHRMPVSEELRSLLKPGCVRADAAPVAHLIGVNGSGMKALAEFLLDLGWKVHGSDTQALPNDLPPDSVWHRVRFSLGHDTANLADETAIVVHSPAIEASNPERGAAVQRGLPVLSYVEMLAELLSSRTAICIAGTHGKTTTTAMVATMLREAGLSVSAIIGGEAIAYGRSGWAGSGELIVIEACEYRRHFLQFEPHVAAILNIEADHFDCFATLHDAQAAFADFAARVSPKGRLILPASEASSRAVANHAACPVERVSIAANDESADWRVSEIVAVASGSTFRVESPGGESQVVTLPVPGQHNVGNALAAIAVCSAVGVSLDAIADGLQTFRGVRRRFEVRGEFRGATIIDDYAHHPTAARATIETARRAFPNRRIVVAFQPHQVSRTQHLMDEFAVALALADETLLVPIFAAREDTQIATRTLGELAEKTSRNGANVRVLTSLDHLSATLEDSARPGDVWLLLGAGNINVCASPR